MQQQLPNQTQEGQYILQDEVSRMVAQIIRRRIDSFQPHRRAMMREIMANIAYLVGEQNIYFENGTIKPIKLRRLINPVVNILLPAVMKDVAVISQNPPKYDFVPAGTDADDRATAICAQKINQHIQRINGHGYRRAQAALWFDIAGIAWRKVYWNPYRTVVGINPPPGQPGHNPNLPPNEAITQGEVEIDIIPPVEMIWDYRLTDLTKMTWFIHAKRRTREWVADRFGPEVAAKLAGKFTANSVESEFELSLLNKFHGMGLGDENQQTATNKMSSTAEMQLAADTYIDYFEYWQKPTKETPAGMVAVMLGDQVVFHSPYPLEQYPHGELPVTPVCPVTLEGVMNTSISRISIARPLQRKYNRVCSQIDENLDIMGNAVIFAPRTAKLNYTSLDNGAGNVIEYDGPVGKPHREPGVPMNSQVFAYLQILRAAVDQVFAFNEPSRGVAPRNIDSAKGIMALQHADTVTMGPIVADFEKADERVAYQAVTLGAANYEPGRMLHIVGNDFEWALFEIDKEQLRGKFNVIIKPMSTMPTDKESDAIKALTAWQTGLLGDPADPELRVWTMQQMSLGNADNIVQRHSKQRNFARKEFAVAMDNLKNMQIPPDLPPQALAMELSRYTFVPGINPFDDHMIHIADHNEYLLDNYWKMQATGNPIYLELLQNMVLHTAQHQQIVATLQEQAFQKQLQAEMMIKGTTPQQLALRKPSPPDKTNSSKKGD